MHSRRRAAPVGRRRHQAVRSWTVVGRGVLEGRRVGVARGGSGCCVWEPLCKCTRRTAVCMSMMASHKKNEVGKARRKASSSLDAHHIPTYRMFGLARFVSGLVFHLRVIRQHRVRGTGLWEVANWEAEHAGR